MLLPAIALIAVGSVITLTPDVPPEMPVKIEHILERQLHIDPELDFDAPLENQLNNEQILNENKENNIPEVVIKPSITSAEYTVNIGEYSTKYDAKNKKRSTNLCLAAAAINGKIINPNEEFSLNKTVGERTYEKGYKDAKIIVGGKYVDGLGGGVCQVSSTLFNAALNANMTITSRTNHTLKSSYVSVGRDATVAWGAIDFKFKNPYNIPVKIIAECKETGVLYIRIMAQNGIVKPTVNIKVKKQAAGTYVLTRTADGRINYVTTSKYK